MRPCREDAPRLRRLALVLLAVGALGSACAPGPGSRDAMRDDAVVVRLLLPPGERPFWEPLARSFEAARPGTRVVLAEGPQATDLRENLLTTSLLARDPTFDLVYLDVTWTPKFAAPGWLLPLDDRLPAPARPAFDPVAMAAGTYDGRLYRVPVRTDMGLLFYRADWLDSAGFAPPATFDELARIARAFHHPPERYGFVWQGKQYEGLVCDFLEVLTGHGGTWVDPETGVVGLDAPEARAALAFLRDSLDPASGFSPPGVTTYQEEESRRVFADGRAAFLRNWPYVLRLAQRDDSPVRGRVGVTVMPAVPGARGAGTLGGWGLGISAYSRHPDAAWAFIAHVTTLEGQRALCAPTGYAPALLAAYEDSALVAANPFLPRYRALAAHAVARPLLPRYALASDILQRHLSAALAGIDTPEHALAAAARETRAALAAGRMP